MATSSASHLATAPEPARAATPAPSARFAAVAQGLRAELAEDLRQQAALYQAIFGATPPPEALKPATTNTVPGLQSPAAFASPGPGPGLDRRDMSAFAPTTSSLAAAASLYADRTAVVPPARPAGAVSSRGGSVGPVARRSCFRASAVATTVTTATTTTTTTGTTVAGTGTGTVAAPKPAPPLPLHIPRWRGPAGAAWASAAAPTAIAPTAARIAAPTQPVHIPHRSHTYLATKREGLSHRPFNAFSGAAGHGAQPVAKLLVPTRSAATSPIRQHHQHVHVGSPARKAAAAPAPAAVVPQSPTRRVVRVMPATPAADAGAGVAATTGTPTPMPPAATASVPRASTVHSRMASAGLARVGSGASVGTMSPLPLSPPRRRVGSPLRPGRAVSPSVALSVLDGSGSGLDSSFVSTASLEATPLPLPADSQPYDVRRRMLIRSFLAWKRCVRVLIVSMCLCVCAYACACVCACVAVAVAVAVLYGWPSKPCLTSLSRAVTHHACLCTTSGARACGGGFGSPAASAPSAAVAAKPSRPCAIGGCSGRWPRGGGTSACCTSGGQRWSGLATTTAARCSAGAGACGIGVCA